MTPNGTQPHPDRVSALETAVAVQENKLNNLADDIVELTASIKGLRSSVLAFALTVAASAVAVLFGIGNV